MKAKSIAVIISLTLVLILTACSSYYTRTIENNWGVSLPKANEELYSVDSGPSIFGDGLRYHILVYEEEVGKILNSLEVSKDKRLIFQASIIGTKKVKVPGHEINCI